MNKNGEYIKLIKQARKGDEASRNRLAEVAQQDLERYLYRITLDCELTQDIVQETLKDMFKVLDKFKSSDNIWGWLRKVASNKVADHHKKNQQEIEVIKNQARPKMIGMSNGLSKMIGEELSRAVQQCMMELKPRHRQILVLRCYEEMRYAEIAEVLGGSEFRNRVLFQRAKKSLQKKLARIGIGKGALLSALVVFGKLTVGSEAAAGQVAVAPALLKVGAGAALVGSAGSTAAILSVAAVGILTIGATMAVTGNGTVTHEGAIITRPVQKMINFPRFALPKGEHIEEYLYYYPYGADGMLMLRMKMADEEGEYVYCRQLQNESMNYRFDRGANTVYVENNRYYNRDLSVMRLPTDSEELTAFLNAVESREYITQAIQETGPGLCVTVKRNEDGAGFNTTIRKDLNNIWREEYFQYPWLMSVRHVDNRDAMHQRGWAYFRIDGEIDGEVVRGTGRLPLVAAAVGQFPAWLRLQVGGKEIVHSSYFDEKGRLHEYPAGSFFKGLSRQWMGLHTVDTVRRDAAQAGLRFETRVIDNHRVEIEISHREENILATNGYEYSRIIYTIDMERDVIEKITFIKPNSDKRGEIVFQYLESEQQMEEFRAPARYRRAIEGEGMEWLFNL